MAEAKAQPKSLIALAVGVAYFFFAGTAMAGQTPDPGFVSYEVSSRLLPEEHALEAEATVRLPPTPSDRETLTFELYSDMAGVSVEVLSPAACAGAAEVRAVGDVGVWGPPFPPNRRWEVRPRRPFPGNTQIALRLKYSGGRKQGFTYYLGPEGSFASTSLWYPSFGDKGVGSLRFVVPRGYVVKATGRLTGQADSGSESVFEFSVEQPSGFSFAAARYLTYRDEEGGVPITLYLLKDRAFSGDFVRGSRRVLRALEREFGRFPRDEFAVVETPSPQSEQSGMGGASVEGFMLANTAFLDQGFNLAYFAHEIGHQWWGMSVSREGDEGMFMLDEALAQYGALRAVEEIEGPAAAEQFRLTGYPGFSNTVESGLGALMFAAAGLDCPLARLGVDCKSMANYELSDSKGFLVYHMLSRAVGPERFRAALRHVTARYSFKRLKWSAFLKEIEQSTGQDLRWFYEQWFDRAGAPYLSLRWAQTAGSLNCTIEQAAPFYRLTLPLQIEFGNGETIIREVRLAGGRTSLSLPVSRRVIAVSLDPHYQVFHSTPELRARAEALSYWARADLLWLNGRADESLKVLQDGLQHLPEADPYGAEFMLRFQIGTIQRGAGRFDEMRREYELALSCPVRWDEYLPRIYLRLGELAKRQGDLQRVRWAVRNVESAERRLGRETGASRAARLLVKADGQ